MPLFEGWSRGEIATEVGLMVLGVMALTLAYCSTPDADAHDAPTGWKYPWACCSSMDCQRVQSGDVTEPSSEKPYFTITATGETIMPKDVRIKQSPDGDYHWCAHQAGLDAGHTICLFVPPKGF
jgi:hypothetical protein